MGFTDLGAGFPGTKSNEFKSVVLQSWRESLYIRLRAHTQRAGGIPPKIIAFTGKRQFQELFFDDPSPKLPISYGVQDKLPIGWPFSRDQTITFVLTSSSGASALTNEVREAPYKELASLLSKLAPWIPEGETEPMV